MYRTYTTGRWIETDDPLNIGGPCYKTLDPEKPFHNILADPDKKDEILEWLERNGYDITFCVETKWPVKFYTAIFGEPIDTVNIGARKARNDERDIQQGRSDGKNVSRKSKRQGPRS